MNPRWPNILPSHVPVLCLPLLAVLNLASLPPAPAPAPPRVPEDEIQSMPLVPYHSFSPTHRPDGSPSPSDGAGDDSHDVCCICLVDFVEAEPLRELPCRHRFHAECVDAWLRQSRLCPMCKRQASARPLQDPNGLGSRSLATYLFGGAGGAAGGSGSRRLLLHQHSQRSHSGSSEGTTDGRNPTRSPFLSPFVLPMFTMPRETGRRRSRSSVFASSGGPTNQVRHPSEVELSTADELADAGLMTDAPDGGRRRRPS